MTATTAVDATVTYYRTTLDPYDLYRIDDIINHAAPDDTSTPAAALASHLHRLNPVLRWHTDDGQSVFEQAKFEVVGGLGLAFGVDDEKVGSYFFLDAAVFDSGDGSPAIVVNLRYDQQMRPYQFERKLYVQPLRIGPTCAAYASTFGVIPRETDVEDYSSIPVKDVRRSEDAAHWVAERDEPVSVLELQMYNMRSNLHARETEPVVPEGFHIVAWDSDTWKVLSRPHVGRDFFTDSLPNAATEEDYPAVCSAVLQGRGFVPVIDMECF